MYVIQERYRAGEPWVSRLSLGKFDTLEEAKKKFNEIPKVGQTRIAEAYTITRYKTVRT